MSASRFFAPFLLLLWMCGAALSQAYSQPYSQPFSPPEGRVKVWVALADKGPGLVVPRAPVGSAAQRRYEDAPVHEPYLQALRAAGLEVATTLKWQNAVSGWVSGARRDGLATLPFVRRVDDMPRKGAAALPAAPPGAPVPDPPALARAAAAPQDFGAFTALFRTVGAATLRDTVARRNLRPGEGVVIALMDADFLLGHAAFDSLFARDAVIDQYDFVNDTGVAVSRAFGNSHGGQVLSQIAGELPGVLQGLAPHARFLLYRTESIPVEAYVEDDFLAAAIERAVDSGAQVINISLGYRYDFDTEPDVPYAHMDGRTRPSSIAAAVAARRGVVVVVAMGNEGPSRGGQPTLVAPADADSILSVGAVNASGAPCWYASTGPSADGRRKPEVSSPGCAMPLANTSSSTGVFNQSGTSFAAPVVAGIAALLRQLHPDSTGVGAQDIRAALMRTAAQDSAPDNFVGHGVVDAARAHCLLAYGAPCAPGREPVAVRNLYVWRGGAVSVFPWETTLRPERVRAWDLHGRAVKLQGRWNEEGAVQLNAPGRRAPGPLILKIPVD